MLEDVWAKRDGKVIFLALDWAKAFDSVSPFALASALRRFGIPSPYVDVIRAIYSDRRFVVKDAGYVSDWHSQQYGICQGCHLSSFLFVIVMSVLLHDAKDKLSNTLGIHMAPELLVHELVYADDTLIMDVDSNRLADFMDCIAEAGAGYGLSFNWKKLEVMPVRTNAVIKKPDGSQILEKTSMIYLGSMLTHRIRAGASNWYSPRRLPNIEAHLEAFDYTTRPEAAHFRCLHRKQVGLWPLHCGHEPGRTPPIRRIPRAVLAIPSESPSCLLQSCPEQGSTATSKPPTAE